MASMEGLVPITRHFLASYYDKYPFAPLSDHVSRLSTEMLALANSLLDELPPTSEESTLLDEANQHPPHKIDENMWKNRENVEEILFLLEKSRWPQEVQKESATGKSELANIIGKLEEKARNALHVLVAFQSKNSEHVFNTVMTYMPQDFRGTIIRQQRERSERNKQAEVDALINSGGSIRDRYALLWKQQMERRRQLAQLGSATGVYKTLVKYLVGVPEVLLEFIQKINDDDGPMEEQRQRYGPPLYKLTTMVRLIRLCISLSWRRFDAVKLREHLGILEQAVDVYTSEIERFLGFIREVFNNAPFFISADVACAANERKSDSYKEISVPAGKTYEVSLSVESINSYIAWDFSLVQGKMNMDIGFSVECESPGGVKTLILPHKRYESDQGNFCTCMAGDYKLIWDNTYSTFFKKVLRYKVDCIPPVVEPVQPAAEE
ncbi:hypothetical protein IC582_019846 [Cucumis melo]|uniref:Uncharacterized protein LOC103501503 isoform X1 n=2 Tax=Cucumis melo TaxID=3656 RepID=A0A1S3CKI8_CUCME|nr:uncharacterized protein LOC103501503 isoform X1 [Cucumis melo]KAA0025747.1 Emp24/gp25L/p24 family/GOLD family protein [Cucumis melo var. makuwa]TYK06178.1 Emp24/gp25L/p24 family/GOLD family protein [Cucumis melo var. makuwa]